MDWFWYLWDCLWEAWNEEGGAIPNKPMSETPSPSSEFDTSLLKNVTTSRDFRLCHPELVKRFKDVAEAYKRMFPARDLIVTCTYRSPEEQQRLFAKGRYGNPGPIVTNCDGKTYVSLHNKFPARAVDVVVIEGGKALWDEPPFYPLGALARECKLEWGGDWAKFKDYPHLQLPRDVE